MLIRSYIAKQTNKKKTLETSSLYKRKQRADWLQTSVALPDFGLDVVQTPTFGTF